jgi:acyl-CoA ligase (AMP-forming) (exosortase A-associated)
MKNVSLLHDLVTRTAEARPERIAVSCGSESISYGCLAEAVARFGGACVRLGLRRGDRVGIYLEKRIDTVTAFFGAAAADCAFVPINPVLKADQVGHILRDCGVRLLVTSPERLALLDETLRACDDLRHVVLVRPHPDHFPKAREGTKPAVHAWEEMARDNGKVLHRIIDADLAAVLYTSGSTGKPKGVMLSHRNLVAGASSVAAYLDNNAEDTLLAALPLSFDAGLSQLTTGFLSGARVALLNYLLPRDVINAVVQERVSGLTAVPPLWIQLVQQEWPASAAEHLRYIANTGGRLPRETLAALRTRLPKTKVFLMYGLTEAFRATYLPPEEVDLRPDSIGKAIPNAEVLVLRPDGTECSPNEPGELVQRGALVAMGYWNDPTATAERFRPLSQQLHGAAQPEIAVYSGDTVRRDEAGFLYFIGRRDEMIKTSGYRVSPTEIEEVLYATRLVAECAAFGVEHPALGQAIQVVAVPAAGTTLDATGLLAECRARLPSYMVPANIEVRAAPLPRNPNGKLDRAALAAAARGRVASVQPS